MMTIHIHTVYLTTTSFLCMEVASSSPSETAPARCSRLQLGVAHPEAFGIKIYHSKLLSSTGSQKTYSKGVPPLHPQLLDGAPKASQFCGENDEKYDRMRIKRLSQSQFHKTKTCIFRQIVHNQHFHAFHSMCCISCQHRQSEKVKQWRWELSCESSHVALLL